MLVFLFQVVGLAAGGKNDALVFVLSKLFFLSL